MQQQTAEKKRPSFILIALVGLVGLCVICIVGSTIMNSLGLVPTRTPTLIPTPVASPTLTNTPEPTNTPLPTDTPLPTATSTPPPQPVILTGAGDSVVDLAKWDGPALARIAHNGGGNFAVWNVDAAGEHMDLLVNTIGAYQGILPLDFFDNEYTHRFEITAGGAWEIQVLPLDMLRREPIPGMIQGNGDDVIGFTTDSGDPDLIKADASGGSGNFAIWSYNSSGRDLVINDIAPYTGTVAIDGDTFILVITATGPWSLEITTR